MLLFYAPQDDDVEKAKLVSFKLENLKNKYHYPITKKTVNIITPKPSISDLKMTKKSLSILNRHPEFLALQALRGKG